MIKFFRTWIINRPKFSISASLILLIAFLNWHTAQGAKATTTNGLPENNLENWNNPLLVNMKLNGFVPNDLADYIEAIAVDDSGAIYVAGKTTAQAFPLANPYQATYGGGDSDGFIAVFAPDGQSLLFSTYLGGNDLDVVKDIAIGDDGRLYVTGETGSSDFPLANPYQAGLGGFVDGFVTVFTPDFQNLSYSTYLGGEYWDAPASVAVESDGTAHLAGYTGSGNFPLLNPIQSYQGNEDVFVTGISPDGQSLEYSTYIGGNEDERAYEIVLDGNGRKYLTGYTESINFPTANAYQPNHAGGDWDGFVTVLSPDSQNLTLSTYLGGSFPDRPYSIQVDINNRIYVGGGTQSEDFPLVNPVQSAKSTGWDGFLAIFNQDGQSLFYSTFLGGNAYDTLYSVAPGKNGRTYAVGFTYSSDFPLMNPFQTSLHGFHDAIVVSLENDGQSLFYSTYLGGDNSDIGRSVALSNAGYLYLGGTTWSTDFPVVAPYQPEISGYVDGFVTILNADGQSLRYSTYLGGAYPSVTDVGLNNFAGIASDETTLIPEEIWLLSGIIGFFVASLFVAKIAGFYKTWITKTK